MWSPDTGCQKKDNLSNIMKIKRIKMAAKHFGDAQHNTSQCLKPGQQDETGKSRKWNINNISCQCLSRFNYKTLNTNC